MLDDEAFEGTGIVSTTLLTDLANAYATVRLNLLWLLAVATRMPLAVVMLALESYYATRCVRIEGILSRGVRTIIGLVAGSRFANRFLKLVLMWPMDWLLGTWQRLKAVMCVDDIKLKLLGTAREAVAVIPEVVRKLCQWVEVILGMTISKDGAQAQ